MRKRLAAILAALLSGLAIPATADVPTSIYVAQTLTSVGALSSGTLSGQSACVLNVAGGATATLTIEESTDNFQTVVNPPTTNLATGTIVALPVSTTTTQYLAFSVSGITGAGTNATAQARARLTVYTSGSVILVLTCGIGSSSSSSATTVAGAAGTAIATALNSTGATAPIACDQTARMTASAANAVLIAHVASKAIYICSYSFNLGLVATTTAQLLWGTGTTCGSNTAAASPLLSVGTAVTGDDNTIGLGAGLGAVDQSPTTGTSDYCLNITGSAVVNGIVRFAQF